LRAAINGDSQALDLDRFGAVLAPFNPVRAPAIGLEPESAAGGVVGLHPFRRGGQDRQGRGRRDGWRPGFPARDFVALDPANDFDYRPEESFIDRLDLDRDAIGETNNRLQALHSLRFKPGLVQDIRHACRKMAAFVSSLSSPNFGFHNQQPIAGLYPSSPGHGGGGLPTGVSFMSYTPGLNVTASQRPRVEGERRRRPAEFDFL
jgi:hypothetical protein